MTLAIKPIPVPLHADGCGGFRVGHSRVALDVVVREFEGGADPEAIVHAYPTLDLADVYAVIAYYLRNREEVNAHLAARRAEADRLRQEIEAGQPDRTGLREKLLARRKQAGQNHASPAEW